MWDNRKSDSIIFSGFAASPDKRPAVEAIYSQCERRIIAIPLQWPLRVH